MAEETTTSEDDWVLYAERAVQRYYDSKLKRDRIVLNEIDFKMKPGEFCSLIGPSGCGKSTLLRLILGSEPPKDGKVLIFGEAPKSPNRDRGIVYQALLALSQSPCYRQRNFRLELDEIPFLMKVGLVSRLS